MLHNDKLLYQTKRTKINKLGKSDDTDNVMSSNYMPKNGK